MGTAFKWFKAGKQTVSGSFSELACAPANCIRVCLKTSYIPCRLNGSVVNTLIILMVVFANKYKRPGVKSRQGSN